MPNILSKQYTGYIHLVNVVLALVASVLTNPNLVNLGLPWIGSAAQAVAALLLILQRLTPAGDTKP